MIKSKTLSKVLAMVLCVMMLISVIPMSVFASIENYNKDYQSETHTVFKHTEQTLAPGVTNYTNYAYSKDGKQMVYYVTTADLTRDDVVAQVAYKDMQNDVYGMDKLSNMVACANEKYSDPTNPQFISEYYTVVSACNGDGYNMTTGEPGGVFIMGGNVKKDWDKKSNPVFLAILNDGTAVIDNTQEAWDACKAQGISEAIDIFGSNLVWDGKDVTANASGSYNTDRHSRTMVGITDDGKLVICVLDGRQEPFSCGGTMHELAQIMLEAGCWRAFNLDGGGSTTFMAKNEGSNNCTVQNRPSDGSERSISNGIIIASTAVPSDTFDHVSMIAKDEYVTIGSSTAITVAGVSPAGTAAEIPAEMTYEAVNGTYENGILTATATGDVVLTAKLGDKAVGSVTIHCVVPEAIKFASDTITVPFGKTATLEMIATYGLNEVVTNANNFTFTLENEAAGTISGLSFTACEEAAGVTGTTITAQFAGSELTAEATLAFGKGSEVLFDFEDGTTNGFKTGYIKYNYYLPNSTTFVADAENGKVHRGDYSLGVNIDYSNSQESGYMMTALYRLSAEGEEGDRPLVGAQRVGMWVYIPDEYVGLWARWVLYPISAVDEEGNVTIASDSITSNTMDDTAGGTGVVYSFNESGWHYLSCDFSSYKGAMWYDGYYCVQFYISDRDGASYNYYAKKNPNINGNFTIYIDDITVDYSTVVEDREAPIFSGVNYATHGMSDAAALTDGANIGYNTVDFSALVAENTAKANATGLDASTAKAYVDGNEVACTYKNGSIAMDDSVVLSAGQHTIKFSICDKQGNYASIIRKVNITSGEQVGVKVVPHNAALDRILFGSLYYVDVVATDIASVQSVTTTLNLDSMNKWELDYMEVAEGFEVTYTYDAPDKILYLTITKTGETSLTGEQALVSIPVRVWELKNAGSIIGGSTNVLPENNQYTYAWFKSQNEYWWVAVNVRVQQGAVTLTDGTTDTFTGENVFCDTEAWAMQKFMVETQEGVDYKAAWNGGHIHTAQALEDKAATCTEAGYTGRTFCEVCNSVVDWGTTVPATGHSYEFVDGVLKCTSCGELFSGEYTDGKTYVNGVVVANGWMEESYYRDGVKLTGLQEIDGYYYDFGNDGICAGKAKLSGFYYDEAEGKYMYFAAGQKVTGEVNAFPTAYFFDENGYAISGDVEIWGYTCTFSEKGEFISSTDASVVDAGFSGTNLNYVLLSDGTLKVGGEGVMKDYTANGNYPMWIIKNEPTAVTSLVIGNGITHIGRFGFYRNQYLKSVSFEEGSNLKSIGWGAFGHCWRLETVAIPASVEVLEEYAFYECGDMKNFTFEEGSRLHTIKDYAFQHQLSLKSLVIPDSVTTLGVGIFYRANSDLVLNVVEKSIAQKYAIQNGLKYETREGYVAPIYSGEYNDSIKWDIYPSGQLVISGTGAMPNHTNYTQQPWINYAHMITGIIIGKDITSIGNYAFAYTCKNVPTVKFEDGSQLQSVGVLAFMNCAKVESIELPDTVTYIGVYAFADCFALENVRISQAASYIGATAFRGSTNVVLNVAEGTYAENFAKTNSIRYTTREYIPVVFESGSFDNLTWELYDNGTLKIAGEGDMTNMANYNLYPWYAVSYKVNKIVIGKDVSSIGNYAFAYGFKNVESIVFESSSVLDRIGVVAFMNVANIKDIVLPDSITYIGVYAFADCFALENVRISQAASYIGATAFRGSTNVVLNVAEGTYSEKFAKANGISYTTRAYIPVVVESGTFDNLTWELYDNGTLKIAGEGDMTNLANYNLYPWYAVSHKVTKIVIGKDVTSIGNYAFAYGFKNVESIVFESGSVLNRIGVVAFMNVANIKDIVLPDSVTYIGAYAFGDCFALETLAVPQMVTYMAPTAFAGSTNVVLNVAEGTYAETFAINHGLSYTVREYVVLPIASGTCGSNATWTLYNDGTLAIDGSGDMDSFQDYKLYPWFNYAHKITKITIGKDITKIGNYAFAYYYQNLETVEFEAGSCLTFVGAVSFMNCAKLQSVILPETVTYIGVYAFADCYALENVYVPAGVTFVGNTAFNGSSNITVSVASGSYAETFVKNNEINHVAR